MPHQPLRFGANLWNQYTDWPDFLDAARTVDHAGFDTLWTWDHLYPIVGSHEGPIYEGWLTLAAWAQATDRVRIGLMVGANTFRNPALVVKTVTTLDHMSGGRAILGIGAGWFERDYDEYGYEFGTAASRLRDLAGALPRIKDRLGRLNPPPVQQPLPLLIGGSGEKVTLKPVAQHATMWNAFGGPAEYQRKSRILDDWCAELGRDPAEIERTINLPPEAVARLDEYEAVGVQHVVFMLGHPFDLTPLQPAFERG